VVNSSHLLVGDEGAFVRCLFRGLIELRRLFIVFFIVIGVLVRFALDSGLALALLGGLLRDVLLVGVVELIFVARIVVVAALNLTDSREGSGVFEFSELLELLGFLVSYSDSYVLLVVFIVVLVVVVLIIIRTLNSNGGFVNLVVVEGLVILGVHFARGLLNHGVLHIGVL